MPINEKFQGHEYSPSNDSSPNSPPHYSPTPPPHDVHKSPYSPPHNPASSLRTPPPLSELIASGDDDGASHVQNGTTLKEIPEDETDDGGSESELSQSLADQGKKASSSELLKGPIADSQGSAMAILPDSPTAEAEAVERQGASTINSINELYDFTHDPPSPVNMTQRLNRMLLDLHVNAPEEATSSNVFSTSNTTVPRNDLNTRDHAPFDEQVIDPQLRTLTDVNDRGDTPDPDQGLPKEIDPRDLQRSRSSTPSSPSSIDPRDLQPSRSPTPTPTHTKPRKLPPSRNSTLSDRPSRSKNIISNGTAPAKKSRSKATVSVNIPAKRKNPSPTRAQKKKQFGKKTSNCVNDSVQGNPVAEFSLPSGNDAMEVDAMEVDSQTYSRDNEQQDGRVLCDCCSDGGKLLFCSADGCGISLCYAQDETACVAWNVPRGTEWLCPKHNSKIERPLKYKLTTRSKSFLHGGRTLQPMLYLHIYPCEKNMDKETLTAPNIGGRMRDLFKHDPVEQFKSISVYLNNPAMISMMRKDVHTWMQKHPQSSVLVVLEGHSAVNTGEIVYAPANAAGNLHQYINVVGEIFYQDASILLKEVHKLLPSVMSSTYDEVFVHNHGQKGMLVLSCGHTYSCFAARQSWMRLVDSGNFTWVVGFSAKVLSPIKVVSMIPTFVELVYLCGGRYSVQESVCRSFDREDLLTHTGILMFEREEVQSESRVTIKEFVLSNCDRPWGLELPDCPTCQVNMFMKANFTKAGSKKQRCTLECGRCKSTARNISPPDFVTECEMAHLRRDKYFIKPFPKGELVVDTWHVKDCT